MSGPPAGRAAAVASRRPGRPGGRPDRAGPGGWARRPRDDGHAGVRRRRRRTSGLVPAAARRAPPGAPEVVGVFVLARGQRDLAILGPKLLGNATNIIFAGAVGRRWTAPSRGHDRSTRSSPGSRPQGQDNLADMLASMHVPSRAWASTSPRSPAILADRHRGLHR